MSDFPLEALILLQTLKKIKNYEYKISIAFQKVNKNKNPSITLAVIAVLSVTRFGTTMTIFGGHFLPTYTRPQRGANVRMTLIFSVMITLLPKGVLILTELR